MSEHTEQAAFFEWAAIAEPKIPELAFLAHWPNGEYRTKATAAKLQRMGVKRGPLDVWLFVRRGEHPGLVLEFKTRTGRLRDEQHLWLSHLSAQGWMTAVIYDWPDAARHVCMYLGADYRQFGL